jgi:hypothetical protein
MNCLKSSVEKVQETPCAQIRQSYADCLSDGSGGRLGCRTIVAQLEDCTAKHVGRLD